MSSLFRFKTQHSKAEQLIVLLQRRGAAWPNAPELKAVNAQTADELLNIIHTDRIGLLQKQWQVFAFAMIILIACSPSMTTPVLAAGLLVLFAFRYQFVQLKKHRYAVYALTRTNDLRLLTPLIGATKYTWGRHPEMIKAIHCLLSQTGEEHSGLLDRKSQELLWYLTVSPAQQEAGYEETFVSIALAALSRVGSREILMNMKRYTRLPATDSTHRHVYKEMQRFIPIMEARLERQAGQQTLVRAADAPAQPLETLLRAASASPSESDKQLLRAAKRSEKG